MKLRINDHLSIIKLHAGRLNKRTPPSVDYQALYAAGLVGLQEAIDRYDSKKNNNFKTYADRRVYGAMVDWMREMSWATRHYRIKNKKRGVTSRGMVSYAKVFEKEEPIITQRWMIGRQADLETAFNQLSIREKTILRLYYYDGLRMRHIAKLFGITQGAISLAFKKAIGDLKLMMKAG